MTGPALSPLGMALRQNDRDRFQTALFAPATCREALFALYAFNYEIARVPEVTHEPLIGQIRLQWWRDALDEIYRGAPVRRHDVAEPLARAIRAHGLTRAHFEAMLEARARDLDAAPPRDLESLEAYAEGASASLVLLALETLGVRGGKSEAVGRSVGIAYALSGLLAAVRFHAGMKRLYIPQDMIDHHRIDVERSVFARKSTPALKECAEEIAALARYHLSVARAQREAVPKAALPALLPAIIAERRLERLARSGYDAFDPRLEQRDTLQSLRLAWAVWRRRY
ncbi:MAG TPA: phytoene/squalene synthase family protein [Stellaceae bacterium]|nr:phytoene/squalene synthase family protein [Stellaceae bacterium]